MIKKCKLCGGKYKTEDSEIKLKINHMEKNGEKKIDEKKKKVEIKRKKFPIIKITESTAFNKPSFEQPHPIAQEGGEGIQKIWRYKNGFGASVVRFSISNQFNPKRKEKIGSYGVNEGLWEMAVLKWENKNNWKLCYTTKITDGSLTEKQVEEYLKQVKKLK